ncbi:MAG: S8 family serine peptidase [Flavisolibacter sp.]
MKLNRLLLLSTLLLLSFISFAQNNFSIAFRSGAIRPEANIRQGFLDSFNKRSLRTNNKSLVVLQFHKIPTDGERKVLQANGIELLDYVSGTAYTATVRGELKPGGLTQAHVRSVVELSPQQKMNQLLTQGSVPYWAVKAIGTVDVWARFPKTFSVNEVLEQLQQLNVDVLSLSYQSYRILPLRIATNRLPELASLPFIEYVQPAPPQDQPLNSNSRMASRANVLNASIANGGRGLNGEGVVVGIGDNSDIQTHVDFSGRLINRAAVVVTGHGTHVSGTLAGAGNINELYRGYAPKATIVSQSFNGILINAPTYVQDYGMVITNNSYGDIIECDYNGTYDMVSQYLDQMAFDFPNLQNVFAAGNSGASTCAPFALGYRTVLGGYQSAKNVLTVGNTSDTGAIAPSSSRGPVKDGRTKPEIVAMGQLVASTWPTNTYANSSGTSMASPAASGGLALLYQRYRQLNGGANPKNALMKAILCNGAADKGNAGPDYQYGFGWMNLLRSMDMLEAGHYFAGNSVNGSTNTHTIAIPANTAQLKVMLYWNDPAASLISSTTLVNDLDLTVTDPSLTTTLPKILDTAIANVGNTATTGPDHINNMEQVVINNPAAGSYNVKVTGTAITQNPSQEYFLVYDIIPVQLKLTAPFSGEALVPGEQTKIDWEAYGFNSGTVTIDYSADNGATWSNVAAGININRSFYVWTVPNVATTNALVRIAKDGGSESNTSDPFTIIGRPTVSLQTTQCEGYIGIKWTAAADATDYEVMVLQGEDMKTVATTTALSYTFNGLSKDSTYWVTVRPRISGKAGRRSVAISRKPNTGNCSGTISDNDLKLDAILAPKSGRKATSTALNASQVVSIRIKNLDDVAISNFTVQYAINGGAWVTENVTASIAAGGTYTHNFATTANLSALGTYTIAAVVKNAAADPVSSNDTAWTTVKHLDNQPIDLGTYFTDDLEAAAINAYQRDTTGLEGIDRYDFSPSTTFGRARTFINSGIAYSRSKALTLDADRVYATGNTNYLYGTFNLSNYNAAANDIRLDFQYLSHSQTNSTVNRVWIRGNDAQPWIAVYDLDSNKIDGAYKKTESIEIADSLLNAGQNFSSSFQIRWGQLALLPATDKALGGGYTFDDIRLYQVQNDMQMKSIDAPSASNCGLTSATAIQVSVRNSVNATVTDIPVRYRINNGAWVTETIPSIAANATLQYTFSTPADLSAFDSYNIQTVVALAGDSFRDNDTLSFSVRNSPVISSYPYLQNFETDNGYWFAAGKNSTWEYGTPVSTHINRAASGVKAWKTRLAGNYNDNEYSYLYSPCFDITAMTQPTLSFSVAMDIEDCGATLCDAAWAEYSEDGVIWKKLGTAGSGTNWYNKATPQVWSLQSNYHWHVATIALPAGLNRLRLRFVMNSDGGVNREGMAIDDIHIYDNTYGIYDGATMAAPVTLNVSGNSWIDFTSNGKLIASVQPNNQSLGATAAQAYVFTGAVRNNNSQYYHNRNITIQPSTTSPGDSVMVRFYFLDSETNSLLSATGCSNCTPPASAYELGISKYSDPDVSFENGTVSDDQQGTWTFIEPAKVTKVPFDKGYYAEFKVKSFSEFWLNNGGFDRSTPLPVKMMEFTAQKTPGNAVVLNWKTGGEADVARYEIEVARGNDQLQAAQFVKIGEVVSGGNSTSMRTYSFTDSEAEKVGAQYYRLKIIDADGSFVYSEIRPVVFDEAVLWQVYPNPSRGNFSLIYQLSNGEKMEAAVYDAKGRLVKEVYTTANGFLQKLSIDLSMSNYASGVYLLQIKTAGKKQSFKLTKF